MQSRGARKKMNIEKILALLTQFAETEAAENEYIEMLMVKASGVSAIRYDKEKLQTQPALDRNETAVLELIKAEERAARNRRRRLKIRLQATGIFHKHLKPQQAYIMDLLYVHGKNVKQAADITGYSVPWIYDIKKQSVENLKQKNIAELKKAHYDKVERSI